MRVWLYACSTAFAVIALACTSCRREQKPVVTPTSPLSTVAPSPNSSSRPALPSIDPKVTKAVGALHRAEQDWLAKSPEAAAAFKRLTETQAAYQGKIEKFGMYMGPARDREARMRDLMAAQEKKDADKTAQAQKAYLAANAAVEKAEADLRLGNPPIQASYDEWLAARKAYAELRQADEAISKASTELMQVTAKQDLDADRNVHVKEN
jgi:hypothetical protein